MSKFIEGFTLLEVLVSLVLLSFVLFEFDGMQVAALKRTETNYFFRVANNELDAMYERLFALKNKQGLADAVARWQAQVQHELPSGKGEVSGEFPHYQVKLSWGKGAYCDKTFIGFSGCLMQEFQFAALA